MGNFKGLHIIDEVNRCLLCYDAPCSKACPHKADPAKFIQSLRFENLGGAVAQIAAGNFPKVCATECHNRPCEKVCIRKKIDRPVEIQTIHQALEELAAEENYE